MRRLLSPDAVIAAFFSALVLLIAATAGNAAHLPTPLLTNHPLTAHAGYSDTNGVNCAILRGSPYLCVKNNAASPIVAVQVVNMGGMAGDSGWIPVPGGPVPPQGTTIVKFPTWGSGCQKLLFVRLATGSSHPFNLDVCNAASIRVNGW